MVVDGVFFSATVRYEGHCLGHGRFDRGVE